MGQNQAESFSGQQLSTNKRKPLLPKRCPRLELGVILFLYLCVGSLYAFTTPLLEVSDEVHHYAMVEHLARGGALPVQDPEVHAHITADEQAGRRPLTYYAQEGSQAPLYYAVMALVVQPFDRSDYAERVWPNPHARAGRADTTNNWNQLVHLPGEGFPWSGVTLAVKVVRWIGVLLGGVAVISTFGFAYELRGLLRLRKPFLADALAPLAAVLVAFNPMFVHIMASVNNDTLATALSSLALWMGARMIRKRPTIRSGAVLGLVLGAAALSKASCLALVLVVPLVVLGGEIVRARSVSARARHLLSLALAIYVPAAAVCGWWYLRNARLYGDFTGTTIMALIAGPRPIPPSVPELIGEWDGFFKAYWGLFGAVNIPMDEPIYVALEVMMALACVGLFILFCSMLECWRHRRPKHAGDASIRHHGQWVATLLIAVQALAAFFVEFVALIRWTSITLASQGRLLFPVIAVISSFTALGLLAFVQRIRPAWPIRRFLPRAISAALATLALAALPLYILPAYRLPERLPDEQLLPSDITRTEVFFGDSIRWIGFRVNTPKQRVSPGEELDITLYWQAVQPIQTNYSAFVRLYGRKDVEVFALDTYPGGGMYQTTLWEPGEVVVDRYRLPIADTPAHRQLSPSVLRLDVGFWDFTTKAFLEAKDGAGMPIGRPRFEAASMNCPISSDEPGVMRFEGAEVIRAEVIPSDGRLQLMLDWRATSDFAEDYTTFVQLFNEKGEKLEPQGDGRALQGDFSPRWWRIGDVIRDDGYVIQLPPDLPPGRYKIKFGLYRPNDGIRMPALDAEGQPVPDAAHTIEVFLP